MRNRRGGIFFSFSRALVLSRGGGIAAPRRTLGRVCRRFGRHRCWAWGLFLGSWHLLGGGQGCRLVSYSAQDGPPAKNSLALHVSTV